VNAEGVRIRFSLGTSKTRCERAKFAPNSEDGTFTQCRAPIYENAPEVRNLTAQQVLRCSPLQKSFIRNAQQPKMAGTSGIYWTFKNSTTAMRNYTASDRGGFWRPIGVRQDLLHHLALRRVSRWPIRWQQLR
jgi:hypothetical protein